VIYLDYTANTPVDSEVLNKFVEVESKFIGNPNSNHQEGKKAKEELAKITENIASLLNVEPSEIIYTSGASESNNLAIKGYLRTTIPYVFFQYLVLGLDGFHITEYAIDGTSHHRGKMDRVGAFAVKVMCGIPVTA
jgi:selenocysteine lyase/cysteine desulfurase